jgi:hypothetical protein
LAHALSGRLHCRTACLTASFTCWLAFTPLSTISLPVVTGLVGGFVFVGAKLVIWKLTWNRSEKDDGKTMPRQEDSMRRIWSTVLHQSVMRKVSVR